MKINIKYKNLIILKNIKKKNMKKIKIFKLNKKNIQNNNTVK